MRRNLGPRYDGTEASPGARLQAGAEQALPRQHQMAKSGSGSRVIIWQIFTRPAGPHSHLLSLPVSAYFPKQILIKIRMRSSPWAGSILSTCHRGPGSRPPVTTHKLQLIDNPREDPRGLILSLFLNIHTTPLL